MKKLLLIAAAVVLCAVTVPAFRHVLAQSGTTLSWGINGNSSSASGDQGGSMELGGGGSGSDPNPISGGLPYIDFHYGNGQPQDYNARIQNSGDGQLQILVVPGGSPEAAVMTMNSTGLSVYHGLSNNGNAIKHVSTNTGCTTGSGASSTTCQVSIGWPGLPFSDTNYAVVCNPKAVTGSAAYGVTWGVSVPDSQRFTDHVVVTFSNLASYGPTSSGGFTCIAIHD